MGVYLRYGNGETGRLCMVEESSVDTAFEPRWFSGARLDESRVGEGKVGLTKNLKSQYSILIS
jgi:hypothetical protein